LNRGKAEYNGGKQVERAEQLRKLNGESGLELPVPRTWGPARKTGIPPPKDSDLAVKANSSIGPAPGHW
jgi:hypothetical protein